MKTAMWKVYKRGTQDDRPPGCRKYIRRVMFVHATTAEEAKRKCYRTLQTKIRELVALQAHSCEEKDDGKKN